MDKIRVIIAEDHAVVREGTRELLDREEDIEVIGEAANGAEAVALVEGLNPDVAILDISMPVVSGLEAARELKKTGSHAKIIFLTVHEESDFVRESFASGGSGYVIKPRLGTDLALAIQEVLAGRSFISPPLSLNDTAEN